MLVLTTKNRRAVWQIVALALVALGVVGGMAWWIDRELRDELLCNSLTVAQTVDAEQLEALALAAGDRARRENCLSKPISADALAASLRKWLPPGPELGPGGKANAEQSGTCTACREQNDGESASFSGRRRGGRGGRLAGQQRWFAGR